MADLSTAPLEPATAASPGRAPSRLGMWALVGVIAVLGIGIIVIGALSLQSDGHPDPVATSSPSPSVSVTPAAETVDQGGDTPEEEAPTEPEPEPTTPPEPTIPPEPTLPPETPAATAP